MNDVTDTVLSNARRTSAYLAEARSAAANARSYEETARNHALIASQFPRRPVGGYDGGDPGQHMVDELRRRSERGDDVLSGRGVYDGDNPYDRPSGVQ